MKNRYNILFMSNNYLHIYNNLINFTRNKDSIENHPIFNLIMKAEKDLGQHLNEVLLMMDSSSIHSLDFSIQKNYDKKIVTDEDINYLINESEQIVKKIVKIKLFSIL